MRIRKSSFRFGFEETPSAIPPTRISFGLLCMPGWAQLLIIWWKPYTEEQLYTAPTGSPPRSGLDAALQALDAEYEVYDDDHTKISKARYKNWTLPQGMDMRTGFRVFEKQYREKSETCSWRQ